MGHWVRWFDGITLAWSITRSSPLGSYKQVWQTCSEKSIRKLQAGVYFPVLIFSVVRFSNQHVLHWNASCIGSGVQYWRTHNRGSRCRIRFSSSHTPLPSGGVFSLDIRGHAAEKSWLLSVAVVIFRVWLLLRADAWAADRINNWVYLWSHYICYSRVGAVLWISYSHLPK